MNGQQDSRTNTFQSYKTRELQGLTSKVHKLSWSNNGRKLATGSTDGVVRVWSVDPHSHGKPERCDHELVGHKEAINNLCWNPGHSDQLASTSSDKTLKIWDVRAARCTVTVKTGQALFLAWSPEASGMNQLVVGTKNDELLIVDVRKGKVLKTHKCGYQSNQLYWSKDGQHLFQAAGDNDVKILKFPSFEPTVSLQGHSERAYSLSLDPQEKFLASGADDGIVSLWDLESMACIRTSIKMDGHVWTSSFSHDSQYLAYTASENQDTHVNIESVATGEIVHRIPCRHQIEDLEWNPRHRVLAIACGNPNADSRGRDTYPVLIFTPP
ncbi:hypothetical protein WJX72_012063 [[Myrmecia] bisecta]|uniref:THO complex subunit 3 n=1 Tax=[Myrmecia] bisecta TaxID=41462 RepID=A0AAW1PTV4_9CHLO